MVSLQDSFSSSVGRVYAKTRGKFSLHATTRNIGYLNQAGRNYGICKCFKYLCEFNIKTSYTVVAIGSSACSRKNSTVLIVVYQLFQEGCVPQVAHQNLSDGSVQRNLIDRLWPSGLLVLPLRPAQPAPWQRSELATHGIDG